MQTRHTKPFTPSGASLSPPPEGARGSFGLQSYAFCPVRAKAFFVSLHEFSESGIRYGLHQRCLRFNRKLLSTTLTLLIAMAAPATMGSSIRPQTG